MKEFKRKKNKKRRALIKTIISEKLKFFFSFFAKRHGTAEQPSPIFRHSNG